MNQHNGKVWHPEEDKKLAEIFPRTDSIEVAKVFGCFVRIVQNRAHRMGIRKDPEWLANFKRVLAKANYEKGGNSGFKKGNKPWNLQEPIRPERGMLETAHGYQKTIKVLPGGRIVRHVMR